MMQKRKIYSETLSVVKTKRQQLELVNQAEAVIESIYNKKTLDITSSVEENVGYQYSEFVLGDYKKSGLSQEDFFSGLIAELEVLEEARVEIPVDLPKRSIDRIASKFEELAGDKLILDVIVNPNVIAGVVFEYKGNHVDYSFDRMFDEKFDRVRDVVMQKLS